MAQHVVRASLPAVFRKTPKGDKEIATRACHRSARQRSVLIMVDGKIIGAEHREAVRFASHFLPEALDPAPDAMGARIQACRAPVALISLLEPFRKTMRVGAGKARADDFWSGVTPVFPD